LFNSAAAAGYSEILQEIAMRTFVSFSGDDEVAAIASGFLDRSLPKSQWTHAAHFATTLWLMTHRADIDLARELPGMIRAYNEATGGANTDTSGYHETITQASLRAARRFLDESPPRPLFATCDALMESALGEPDWLLVYWSRERLFSVEARRAWVGPDLNEFPF
jgi:hypothetical protein